MVNPPWPGRHGGKSMCYKMDFEKRGRFMPLGAHEVVVGAVAILDGDALFADQRVDHGWRSDRRSIGFRPFLCVQSFNGQCKWVMLTTQHNPKRLLLDRWKIPGSPKWMSDTQYLGDAREVLSGPLESFISAGRKELTHQPHDRPSISKQGVDAVLREIDKYLRGKSTRRPGPAE
jgi:hypothetical protein